MQNSAAAKLDTSQNLTSFLSIKLPTRLIRPISPHIKVFSSIEDVFIYPFLSSCRATDVATGRACHDPKGIARQGKIVDTGSAAASKNRPAACFSQLDLFRAPGGGTWRDNRL